MTGAGEMGFEYGYCRVSTQKQRIDRQIRNIREVAKDAIIYQEKYTGTARDERKEFMRLLSVVKPGDTIYFDSVSRMSRNAEEGFRDYEMLYNKGVTLVFLKEPHINTEVYRKALSVRIPLTDTPADIILRSIEQYLMEVAKEQIRMAFEASEREVRVLRQRTKEGLVNARKNGSQVGRKAGDKLETAKSREAKKKILKHSKDFGGSLTDQECMDLCKISRGTFYRYKKELQVDRNGDCKNEDS